jgi:hypothetical protein
VTVNWGDCLPYVPLHAGVSSDLPRALARAEYRHLMAARPERRTALTELLALNGVVLSDDDEGVAALDAWFVDNVELSDTEAERLRSIWYAMAVDMGLFMGDLAIRQSPGLHWEFFTWGKRNVLYQRAVIMGFSQIEFPRYGADLIAVIAGYGLRVASGSREGPGRLVKMMASMRAKA